MLAEGILLLRKGITPDLLISATAVGMYLYSAVATVGVFIQGRPFYGPLLFHGVVVLLAGWCGYRWWRMTD
jgi:hypothetical protein